MLAGEFGPLKIHPNPRGQLEGRLMCRGKYNGRDVMLKMGPEVVMKMEIELLQLVRDSGANALISHFNWVGTVASNFILPHINVVNSKAGRRFVTQNVGRELYLTMTDFFPKNARQLIMSLSRQGGPDTLLEQRLYQLIKLMIEILMQLQDGARMLHQDPKPDNFMVRADGSLVLIDFEHAVAFGQKNPDAAIDGWGGRPTYDCAEEGTDGFIVVNSILNYTTVRITQLAGLRAMKEELFPTAGEVKLTTYYTAAPILAPSFQDILRAVARSTTSMPIAPTVSVQ
jgi:serine/threonine protein kinase